MASKAKKAALRKETLRKERYVEYIVGIGFFLLLCWMIFLYPHVFVDIRLVLMLLFRPGLFLTPLLFKIISGDNFSIRDNLGYNFTRVFLAYMMVTMPVGNTIVTSFLFSNYLFAQHESKTVILEPFNIRESRSRSGKYSHLDVEYDGIVKQINLGDTPLEEITNKSLNMTISKGLFGYYIIIGHTLTTKHNK